MVIYCFNTMRLASDKVCKNVVSQYHVVPYGALTWLTISGLLQNSSYFSYCPHGTPNMLTFILNKILILILVQVNPFG